MNDEVINQDELQAPVDLAAESRPITLHAVEGKGFGRRVLAYIIDWSILSALNLVGLASVVIILSLSLMIIFYPSSAAAPLQNLVPLPGRASLIIVGLLVNLAYFVPFEGMYGATPGKLILGMRVIKEKDGRLCDLKAALHRGLWRFIDGIVFGAIAFTNMEPPLQQRLGDKKASTIVVGKDEPAIQETRGWPRFLAGFGLFIAILMVVSFIQIGVALYGNRATFQALAYFRSADANFQQGDLYLAIANYDRAIKLVPENAVAYYYRGSVYYSVGQLERAITDYDRAIELDPNLAPAYNNRGNAYHGLGELEQAITDYDRAIELDPEDAVTYYNRGYAYQDLGELERAIADYRETLLLTHDPELRQAAEDGLEALGGTP